MNIELMQLSTLSSSIQSLECVTKTLAFQTALKGSGKKKLVISTQFLELLGWTKGTRIKERSMGFGRGLRISKLLIGEPNEKKVYEREYKKRRRTETLMDIRSQAKIDEAFCGASHARIVIKKTHVDIYPLFDATNWKAKGATIKVPSITAYDDSIIQVLRTIKEHKITHCNLLAERGFWNSTDAVLLKLQLKRSGYKFSEEASDRIYISNGQPAPQDFDDLPISYAISAQAPPFTFTLACAMP